jgi:hypothetical protein
LCFKEASLVTQEKEAAKAEGETHAMLFAMLQDQYDKQIMAIEATNKANMEAIIKWMDALVAAGGNKENTPTPGANATGGNKCGKAKKHHCPNCKKMVIHKV